MKYRIYGKPLNHDEMIEYAIRKVGLYAISGKRVIGLVITGIMINLDTKQWEFCFDKEELFDKNELIFKTKRSADLYLKRINRG